MNPGLGAGGSLRLVKRLLAALGLLALVAIVVAGCGSSSSDKSSLDGWANDLCTSVDSYVKTVSSAGESLKNGNLSAAKLESAAGDVRSATDKLVGDIQELGGPPLQSKTEAKQAMDNLSTELSKHREAIKAATSNISGATDALNAVPVVTSSLAAASTAISNTFDQLKQLDAQGELQKAFRKADSCSSLTKP